MHRAAVVSVVSLVSQETKNDCQEGLGKYFGAGTHGSGKCRGYGAGLAHTIPQFVSSPRSLPVRAGNSKWFCVSGDFLGVYRVRSTLPFFPSFQFTVIVSWQI